MSEFGSLIFYIVIYIISCFFFSFYKFNNKYIQCTGVSLAIIIPSVVAGMRYDVGTDYKTYYHIFEYLSNVTYKWILTDEWHMSEERGFLCLVKFLSSFFGTKTIFGILAFLMLSFFSYTIIGQYKKYNLTIVYMVYLFGGFTSSFNILRQEMAVLIVFFALKYVVDNKPVKYGISVGIAMLFHSSAIIAILVWFLWNHTKQDNIKMKRIIPIFGIVIFSTIFWKEIMVILDNTGISFIRKYIVYLAGNDTRNRSFYLKILLSIFFLSIKKNFIQIDKKLAFFIDMYWISAILEYTGFFITFVKRISGYFSFPENILLSAVPFIFTKKENKIIAKVFVYVYVIALFIITSYILNQGGFIPYRTN